MNVSGVTELEEIVMRAGALSVAVMAITTFVIFLVRNAILRPLDNKLDAQSSSIKRDVFDRLDEIQVSNAEKFARVEYELKANGGGSLRDDVRAVHLQIERLQGFNDRETTTQIQAQANIAARVGQHENEKDAP